MTIPLTANRTEEALDMMDRLYAELELPFVRDRARGALEGLPAFGGWWFLEEEGSTVGYFVLTVGYSLEFGGRFALLDELLIEEPWRGRGIGSAAMQSIVEHARAMGVGAIHLEADIEVQGFYARHGFVARNRDMMTMWL